MEYELKSVGCVIDTETLIVSRLFRDASGEMTKGIGMHIDDVDKDFFYRLDDNDFGTIDNLINNRI